ncbi:hypothetical protein BCR32DRAFT_273761 [Anaeromyces robustus]|uniref:Uncharacterized protein n=1 Tax=Anaeromyces robustus TaxID=1754192 RepID=A0A1Y1XR14_9FUNG|nr:hypothetical protein BCR32DRAFT_273761 [Anaeromyces robustus]|eukprot:ORX88209.1 hypothetical protein BCR32DRAFT_273761 [Anaeromyces robustus]
MNFKSIFGITTLVLLGLVNAVPVSNVSETVVSTVSKTYPPKTAKTYPPKLPMVHVTRTKVVPTPNINVTTSKTVQPTTMPTKRIPYGPVYNKCLEKSGIPFIKTRPGEIDFTCLVKYTEGDKNSEINPDNSYCFLNKGTIYCVDSELTKSPYCKKEKDSIRSCLIDVYNIVTAATITERMKIERPVISYPDMDKFVVSPREDQTDCRKKGGIVVTFQTVFQYICFAPAETFESTEGIYCATFNGKRYCFDEDYTSGGFCNLKSKYFDSITCNHVLEQFCKYNNITLEDH